MEVKCCNKCNVELVVGENWFASSAKNGTYTCKPCYKNVSKKWINKNKNRHKTFVMKNKYSIPPGVYSIIKDKEIIYIGHSKAPYARIKCGHFSMGNSSNNNSPIYNALSTGELKRKDLSFNMLEYIDDEDTRKKREYELIRQYTPKYNVINPLDAQE